jgi:hypothetical protein
LEYAGRHKFYYFERTTLVDHVIPDVPVRQSVLFLPIPLRLLLAAQPKLVRPVLQVVHRVIAPPARSSGPENKRSAVSRAKREGEARQGRRGGACQ